MAPRRKPEQKPPYQRQDDANENLQQFFDKVPPNDQEAERALLGAVLLQAGAFDEVSPILVADCFYYSAHRELWRVAHDMREAAVAIDALTVAREAERRGVLEDIGGPAFINTVMEACHYTAHAIDYAQIVRECWLRRRAILAAQETLKDAFNVASDTEEMIEAMETRVLRVVDRAKSVSNVKTFDEILTETFRTLENRLQRDTGDLPGITTGIHGLDAMTGGFLPGQLIVLAARPGMGKTALLGNMTAHICDDGGGVHVASCEMSSLELAERWLQMVAKINSVKIRRPMDMTGEEQTACYEAGERMRGWRLTIDETGGQTPSIIASAVRRNSRKGPLSLVIVDYIQIMEIGNEESRRWIPREEQVSMITRRLKKLAKDMGVPVLAACQLNRNPDNREDKRPRLADLRESGAIEQDADIVMFIHRPDAYDPGDRPGEADLIVAKHRGGPTGTVSLVWLRELCRFADKAGPVTPKDF